MTPVLFALVGAVLAAFVSPLAAAVLGFLLGLVWKRQREVTDAHRSLRADIATLRTEQERLVRELRTLREAAPHAAAPPAREPSSPPREAPLPAPLTLPPPPTVPPPPRGAPPERAAVPPLDHPVTLPTSTGVIEFFTTGNVVAKVGMIIVFFGVAFLVRYAADRGLLPIEYRLMATVAGALVLLGVGWRLRRSRPEYAMVLQGGAIGLLYLTIFAAFRLYGLLPAVLTFVLLLFVVVVSGMLAVLQNAVSLAALGTTGGFLAPMLVSTGGGSHVALFSYYAALNLGVFTIAWFRSWRILNLLAFVFTFGIGSLWGSEYYRPELFATTEPFLVGFFVLFLALAVLVAHVQPPELRGYIDGTLVFGLPAVAFAMQSVLVRQIPFGRAYSAVALAAVYLALARLLWRRDAALQPLTEAFLALAAVFLILAVPLAFDGHATAAAWALEGTGLVWIGIRQNRLLARLAGSGLLLGAGVAFAAMAAPPAIDVPVLNTRFLGSVAIAAGSIVAARLWSSVSRVRDKREHAFEWVLLIWGLLWWFGALFVEIEAHVRLRYLLSAALLGAAASVFLFSVLARRLSWRAMTLAIVPMGPLLWVWVVGAYVIDANAGPLPDLGWLAWPAVVACSYLAVFWFESTWPSAVAKAWHAGTAWVVIFLVTWALAVVVGRMVPETGTWSATVWCVIPALAVMLLLRAGTSPLAWPLRRNESLYEGLIAGAPMVTGLLWVVWAGGQTGTADPLPYVPLLNPLELTQALGLFAGVAWTRRRGIGGAADERTEAAFRVAIACVAFAALNMMVGRIVHFYLSVPFDLDSLMDSYVFQAGISILWGVTAGALMTLARLRLDRAVWITGAGLLTMLIVKLFLVDLGNVGGVARIVSFLATGALILAIGYFAPVPPRPEKAA